MKKNPPEHREFPRGNVLIWSFFFSSRYFLYWKNRRKFSSQLLLCACYWVTGLWLLHLAFRDRSKAYRFIVNVKTGDGRGRNYKETAYCSYKIVKWVIEILDVVYKNDFLLSVDEVLKCSDVIEEKIWRAETEIKWICNRNSSNIRCVVGYRDWFRLRIGGRYKIDCSRIDHTTIGFLSSSKRISHLLIKKNNVLLIETTKVMNHEMTTRCQLVSLSWHASYLLHIHICFEMENKFGFNTRSSQ